jgi:transcriptional regulator with XRE-family HTH domain
LAEGTGRRNSIILGGCCFIFAATLFLLANPQIAPLVKKTFYHFYRKSVDFSPTDAIIKTQRRKGDRQMEIRLAESIRKLRKGAGFTQEQLAGALGVSVSAVHKWESGKATPELEMLVNIAEFFETSVDAMLNYGWQKRNMGQTAEQIRSFKSTRNFKEGLRFAEQALQKYPTSFDVVYESALLYYMSMFHHRGQDVHRTISLLEKAIELIDQNTRESVCSITIQNRIADCYCYLDNMEKAVEVLKQNNIGGLNDAKIGLFLSQNPEKAEESLGYLSDALHSHYSQIYEICMGYANAYSAMGQLAPIEDMMHWLLHLGWGLKRPDMVNIIDKTDVRIYTILAGIRLIRGDQSGAEKWLREAKRSALRFDADPQYRTAHGMKYYHSSEKSISYDDMGETGMAMIENFLSDESESKNLRPIWEKIQAEDSIQPAVES